MAGSFMLHTATWFPVSARIRRTTLPSTRISQASHSPSAVFCPETYTNSALRPQNDSRHGSRTRANCDFPASLAYPTYSTCAASCDPVMLYRTRISRPAGRFAGFGLTTRVVAFGLVITRTIAVGVGSADRDGREQEATTIPARSIQSANRAGSIPPVGRKRMVTPLLRCFPALTVRV